MNYQTVLSQLAGKSSKKVANNTYLIAFQYAHSDVASIRLTLHSTTIIEWYADGRIVLDSGGYRTPTTKARLNAWLPRDYRIRINSKGAWWLSRFGIASGTWLSDEPFKDGMIIHSHSKHLTMNAPMA